MHRGIVIHIIDIYNVICYVTAAEFESQLKKLQTDAEYQDESAQKKEKETDRERWLSMHLDLPI